MKYTDLIARGEAAMESAVFVTFDDAPANSGFPAYVTRHDPHAMSDRFYVVKHVPATIVPVLITAIRELEAERDEANKRAAMQTVSSMGQAWDRITAEAKVARLEGEVTALEWFAEISAAQAVATKHKVDALTKGEPMTDKIDRAILEGHVENANRLARYDWQDWTVQDIEDAEGLVRAFIRIAALPPAPDAEADKLRRTIAARDRRIERLVAALDDARAKGYVTQSEQEPPVVLSVPDAVEALVKAVEKLGLRELVAGWNGENKDKPYAPHPPSLGATIKTTCGVVYEVDAAIRALGGDA